MSFSAPVPSVEKLLSDDTLFLLTAPDFARLRAVYNTIPEAKLWHDPALKAFRDNFVARWTEEVVKPLDRDFGVRLSDYTPLVKGQLTLAVTRDFSQGNEDQPYGILLLLDTKDKGAELKSNLAKLRKSRVDAGKSLRIEKIRDLEFLVLSLSSSELPQTLNQFFPHPPEVQQLGSENEPKKALRKGELIIGQADSLLLVSTSVKALEKVIARLTGGSMPALGEIAAYQANHLALFRDSPLYGWVNIKALLSQPKPAVVPKESQVPDPFPVTKPGKMLAALGLTGANSFAFSFQQSNEGSFLQMFLDAPESRRQGLLRLLAGESLDSSPPPFVPADAVKFQRWRIDGPKAWTTLEKLLADISPQSLSAINFILDTANLNARTKDPGFDVRKSLIANLGNDLISYEKAARGPGQAELSSPPSIVLLGSPNPEQFVAALKNVLIFMTAQAAAPAEREFLGRKILSVPLPALPLPVAESKPGPPRTLHYAASAGYVALSTDASLLEEFVRSSESQAKGLRETAGLIEASQKVTGPGTTLFGFENLSDTMRAKFEELKREGANSTNSPSVNPLAAAIVGTPEKSVQDWMDFSLLPPFESVSKYFHFSVYGASATVDGLTFKYFRPVPPALKTVQPSGSSR